MSYTIRLVQTRPNTGVEFWTPTAGQVAKIEEWVGLGKIESHNLNTISEDQLSKTMSVTLASEADFRDFETDETLLEGTNSRIAHCTANSISYSLETDE
tara:strand:+ start:680 stop:976 length:297 start_codon:yes stop_codon:yes gene_type:complete